jgi:Na+(H+)/acetate symporter ActP
VYGALGRVLTPSLYVTGETDLAVLRVPEVAWPGLGGELLAALVAAGAFAAFMSTASGLLVSVSGTIAYDLWGRLRHRPPDSPVDRVRSFRVAAPLAMVVPALLALATRDLDITILVSWAFALAASTFCPVLLLGIWWPRLTARGATAGMLAGGLLATAGFVTTVATGAADNATSIVSQPAVVSVPVAFLTMVLVSRLAGGRQTDAEAHMLALHAPEGLGVAGAGR